MGWLTRLRPDPYIVAILLMVGLATLLPVSGQAALDFGWFTKGMIALLFFLHGAKLSREAVIAGLTHWRLHLLVLGATFVLFPLLGLSARLIPAAILPPTLSAGVLFLCCLPSTVQSSIAFTSVARGNVAAAVCAASASNLFGIFITPLLIALLMQGNGSGISLGEVESVVVQLLLPFIAGQIARRWIGGWMKEHSRLVGLVDRGSILLIVYGAFSDAVTHDIWHKVSLAQILWLVGVCCVLLAVILALTTLAARMLGFNKEDEITIVFCGSKKSLASGVPMANILFPPGAHGSERVVGMLVLPLMIFHQLQLMACAVVAQRYAARPEVG